MRSDRCTRVKSSKTRNCWRRKMTEWTSEREKVLWRSRSSPSSTLWTTTQPHNGFIDLTENDSAKFVEDCSSSTTWKKLKLKSGSIYIPKDKPNKPEGDDAHFITEDECTIGVADGVGGWSKHGIDSGVYARQLMSNSLMAIQNRFPAGSVVDPLKVLNEAFSKTKAQGSSTACILTLLTDKKQSLHAVNIGDSGFIIIRNGRTVYHSPVQQSRFNCPYQLGNTNDRPSKANVIRMDIEEGDVIVVGTDGLFDNMWESEIEETVARAAFEAATSGEGGVVEPQEVAWKLAQVASFNSSDAHKATPFQVESGKAGKTHRGGKVDDITVIVSFVQHS